MTDIDKKVNDVLGLAPYAESVNTVTKGGVNMVGQFLSLTCKPLLEEVGLWARDRFRVWRYENLYNVLEKAAGKVDYMNNQVVLVNPRVAFNIAENASLVDDDEIQELWAGLFISSASSDGRDDSNIIFSNLLKQMTSLEARILQFAFDNCVKVKFDNGLIMGCRYTTNIDTIFDLCQISDLDRIDRELDALRSLGLILNGIPICNDDLEVDLTLTALAIHLVARCNGYSSVNSSLDFISEQDYMEHPEFHVPEFLQL